MPFTSDDCPYSSEMYTESIGVHYRCNFITNSNELERPLCDLTSGSICEISKCRIFK